MLIVGNLDVETTWARLDAAARRARGERAPSPDDPRFALPEHVLRRISALATLLRAFATSDDDELWTPRPVDPGRMAPVGWQLPRPRLLSGPRPERADVWWGEPTEVAARVNHRLFAWHAAVGRRLPRLPGAMLVHDVAGLERCAADLALAGRVRSAEWVAKAPLSSAGRLRVRGAGAPTGEQRAQARRLLDLQGVLVFEPWVRRIADFGVAGRVSGSRVEVHAIHGLEVDGRGRFLGIRDRAAGPDAEDGVRIGAAAAEMGEELRAAGYAGPFGVDGFLYEPGRTLRCVSEVNARRTFGDVAASILDVARETLVTIAPSDPAALMVGSGPPPSGTIPLLLPGKDDDTSAWLEVPFRHGG